MLTRLLWKSSLKMPIFEPLRSGIPPARPLPTCYEIEQALSSFPPELGNFPSTMGYLSRPLWPILVVCSQA
jgi:hypothetical protein